MNITEAYNKFSITTDIRNILIGNSGITQMVGNNIYPIIAPENTTGDIILYYRDEYGKEYTNGNVIVNENCKIFIAILSENYDRSIQITEKVNELIEGTHLNKNNYKYNCRLIDSTEDFEDKKYIQILLFQIV